MAHVSGIPAGGLFNEIYAEHLKKQSTHTEKATSAPTNNFNPMFEPLPGDEKTKQKATMTRPKTKTINAAEEEYGGGMWLWHTFVSLCAMLVYIMFVVGPVGASSHPGPVAALLLYSTAIGVWIGVYHWLKRRWMKKNADLSSRMVQVNNGTEEIVDWVPRLDIHEHDNHRGAGSRTQRGVSKNFSQTLYPSLKTDKEWVPGDELKDQMRHLKNYMDATGNVPDWANKDIAGFEKIFGAACEVTTARDLASLNRGEVYNDIVLRNSDGSVSANIDHLLVIGSTAIMLDSKWWSVAPEFVTDQKGRNMVSAHGPHARAVSTCIYEASFLPHTPRAIVFCVRGKAASEMGRPQVVDSYNEFVPFEDSSRGVKSTPCPVIFAPSGQIKKVVEAVARGGDVVAGVFVPSGTPNPFTTSELNALEVTTDLTFER